ncbi:DUF2793 domain-containing protein [Croceicoccus sp. F390]|uniref:DUF2793 domain-containing protein n=1 Tax=Croceicoccus esteveae TaxID=3075597 RepID=A0ABU2ZIV3_9SPHN|nr:DUF2793 domain-containing protein [Croceicoccus sp. F390]MDT0576538.1 DUF2793 domain-containing protein [Croceicoccus sp. F390]
MNPPQFADTTARFGLPFLFAAQAQKEFFVNEAFARADAIIHCAVEGGAITAPAVPADGQSWLVMEAAEGVFAGREGEIACRQNGQWIFVEPVVGMRVFDKELGRDRRYVDGWQVAADITAPAGGTQVDAQAREAIEQILSALAAAGVISTS